MPSSPALLVGLLLLTPMTVVVAQREPAPGPATAQIRGPAPSALFSHRHVGPLQPTVSAEPRDSLRPQSRPTYWKEGALIGGALGAVGGAVVGHELCGLEESVKHCTGSAVLGGLLGAVVLAIPGALIGGQFSKEPEEAAEPVPSTDPGS